MNKDEAQLKPESSKFDNVKNNIPILQLKREKYFEQRDWLGLVLIDSMILEYLMTCTIRASVNNISNILKMHGLKNVNDFIYKEDDKGNTLGRLRKKCFELSGNKIYSKGGQIQKFINHRNDIMHGLIENNSAEETEIKVRDWYQEKDYLGLVEVFNQMESSINQSVDFLQSAKIFEKEIAMEIYKESVGDSKISTENIGNVIEYIIIKLEKNPFGCFFLNRKDLVEDVSKYFKSLT